MSGPLRALAAAVLAVAALAVAQGDVTPLAEARALLDDERNTIEIVRAYGPSIVTVAVEVDGRRLGPLEGLPDDQVPPQFRNGGPPQPREGTGTGFLVGDGMILTNHHVVRMALAERSVELRPRARITVRFPGVEPPLAVRVVGASALHDLALLTFVDPAAVPAAVRALPSLRFADSDAVEPGQKAIAIGNPFGFESTVTVGTVSGLARRLVDVGQADMPFIQTDTAINPGSSGGPLLDSTGAVIGVNTAILPGSSFGGQRGFIGLGFAIPSNLARAQLAELAAGGWFDIDARARLGVSVVGLDTYPAAVRGALGLPPEGVMVLEVEAGGAAAAAGIRGASERVNVSGQALPVDGDVVLAVDGVTVRAAADLQRAVLARSEGDVLELRVWRAGEERMVVVALARVR